MVGVGAGLRHQVVDGAGAVSVLRRHVQLQLLEFLHRVLNRRVDDSAAQTFVGDAVDQESVEVFAQPVHDRAVTVFKVRAAER